MVTCKICNKKYKQISYSHLKNHGMTSIQYLEQFPNAKLTCDATGINVSNGTKRGMDNDIVRNKLKYKRTPETLKKLSESVKQSHKNGVYDDVYDNKERNRKIAKGQSNYWKRVGAKEKVPERFGSYVGSEKHINIFKSNQKKATMDSLRCKTSKSEKEFAEKLRKEGIEFEQQFYVKQFPFDFFIPSRNLLIEIDGEFYHPLTKSDCVYDIQKHNYERDIRKTKVTLDTGYNLERIRV